MRKVEISFDIDFGKKNSFELKKVTRANISSIRCNNSTQKKKSGNNISIVGAILKSNIWI